MFNILNKKNVDLRDKNELILLIIFSLPLFLITGPFFPDLIVSILSLIFITYVLKKNISKEFIFKFKLLFLFWFLIIFSSLFSTLFSESLINSLILFRFIFFIIFFTYLFSLKEINNFFFYFLLCIILILSIDSYLQLFTEKNILGFIKDDPKRLSGFFGDEYILGSYLLKFWPIVLFLAPKNDKVNNILIVLFFVVIEPLIFFAGQRAPLIMSFCLVLGLLMINYKNYIFYISLFFSIIIIGSNLFFNEKYNERYIFDVKANLSYENTIKSEINDIEEKNLSFSVISPPHTQIFYNSFLLFKEKPFFGHGIKSFRKVCVNNNEKGCSTHPHNYYLQFLAETGIFVFIFVIIFYINLIFKFCKILFHFFKHNNYSNKSYFSYLNLLIVLFPFQSTGNVFNNYMLIQLSFILSLYFIAKKHND